MAGIDTALNLRELRERLKIAPVECLFHHFCETQIRPTFDDPEFRNDFAIWTARELHDRVLAERLGIINPYANGSFEDLRAMVIVSPSGPPGNSMTGFWPSGWGS
jgi:hypothetical protein